MGYTPSWKDSLKKAEEAIGKTEDFYARDDPMTEIDKVRGTEHAYYDEKVFKEAEEALAKVEEEGRSGHMSFDTEGLIEWIKTHGNKGIVNKRDGSPMTDEEAIKVLEDDLARGRTEVSNCPNANPDGSCPSHNEPDEEPAKGEEEAPLDAKAVKSALNNALVDATNLVQGIETYLGDLENLDYEDIDNAIEVVNNILQTLKDAKEMGFATDGEVKPKPIEQSPSQPTEEPKKGEA